MIVAIYSRKSKFTGKGESIENQIEMCKEYAEKQFGHSELEYIIYEDEGFTAANTKRSSFQKMLRDAKNKKYDVLICYRLDRVSRNIAHFSSLIEELEVSGISFVSIREQFDTTNSIGRAMMFISSVFAQLERETIAERIKDNMHELAKTGRWLGGVPPLGFQSEHITHIDDEFKEHTLVKLSTIASEMQDVELIYNKYSELGSIYQVRKWLIQNNKKTKKGAVFSSRAISDILRNPAYVKADNEVAKYLENNEVVVAGLDRINGKRAILLYNKRNKKGLKNEARDWIGAVAKHEGYIPADKWLKIQEQLDKNRMKLPRVGTSEVALLSGILRCKVCDSAMNVTYGRKRNDGTAHHYYTCNMKIISGQDKCNNPNVNGSDIDNTVVSKITQLAASNKEALLDELEEINNENNNFDSIDLLDELKNKKAQILKEINNLVEEISKSTAASKYILPQIEARDKEVKDLEENISKLENEKEEKKKESEELALVANNILNFNVAISGLSNKEKKYFLQSIADKVFWDGDSGEVAISLLTDSADKKKLNKTKAYNLSQFSTAPCWPCDQDHARSVT